MKTGRLNRKENNQVRKKEFSITSNIRKETRDKMRNRELKRNSYGIHGFRRVEIFQIFRLVGLGVVGIIS